MEFTGNRSRKTFRSHMNGGPLKLAPQLILQEVVEGDTCSLTNKFARGYLE